MCKCRTSELQNQRCAWLCNSTHTVVVQTAHVNSSKPARNDGLSQSATQFVDAVWMLPLSATCQDGVDHPSCLDGACPVLVCTISLGLLVWEVPLSPTPQCAWLCAWCAWACAWHSDENKPMHAQARKMSPSVMNVRPLHPTLNAPQYKTCDFALLWHCPTTVYLLQYPAILSHTQRHLGKLHDTYRYLSRPGGT